VQYRAIVFDLDGTLIDTLDDLAAAMNHALQALGLPPHPRDACRLMIGNGTDTFALRALGPGHAHLKDRLLEIMMPYYRQHAMNRSRVYDGVTETVDELRRRGLRLAVVTNKDQPYADQVMGHFFSNGAFDQVVGVGPHVPVKPDPTGTLRALEALAVPPGRALFVGDSEIDVATARRAGVPFVGVTWGFRDPPTLRQAGAQTFINTPTELLDLVS